MKRVESRREAAQRWLIASIALLAPLLGGSTERWSQGIVLMLIALAVFLDPPVRPMSGTFSILVAAALVLGLIPFLPAAWWGEPWWKKILIDELGLALPTTLSPQPWLTFEAWLLLLAGILWLSLVGFRPWRSSERRWLARAVCGGLLVLTGVWLVAHYAAWRVPIWESDRNFGPFPNRNQTGNLLATWSVVAAACALEDFRSRRWSGCWWAAGVALSLWGLIVNYSRAGVLFFFFGLTAWGAFQLLRVRSWRSVAIGVAPLLIAASLFAIFGGGTLERFTGTAGFLPDPMDDFRGLVFRDAWKMALASPWSGIGLGNFEGMFALSREVSANNVRVIHPESDWLWLLTEMGWLGPLLALGVLALFVRRTFPLGKNSAVTLRSAALVGAVVFGLHGFVDVAGHRLGSALPGLLLFGIAAQSSADRKRAGASLASRAARAAMPFVSSGHNAPDAQRMVHAGRPQRAIARLAATIVGATGAMWIAATFSAAVGPGSIGTDRLREEAAAANQEERFADAVAAATRAAAWASLDWENYFLRAVANAFTDQPELAARDFLRARRLEPSDASVPFEEGVIWAYFSPGRAAAAWAETLRRDPGRSPDYYRRMLTDVNAGAELRASLRELAAGQADLLLVWLTHAPADEARLELDALVAADPQLTRWSPQQLPPFFDAWGRVGNRSDLIRALEGNAAWQEAGWRQLARAYAEEKDYERACRTVHRFALRPTMPRMPATSVSDAMTSFARNPRDFIAGYRLLEAQVRADSLRSALATLDQLSALEDAPPYLAWLRGDIHEHLGEWSAAWSALKAVAK